MGPEGEGRARDDGGVAVKAPVKPVTGCSPKWGGTLVLPRFSSRMLARDIEASIKAWREEKRHEYREIQEVFS